MATRFLKILSNGNKILKFKLMTAPSYMIIFHFSFPFSIGLATINVVMVLNDIIVNHGKVNPLIIMASAFQVLYALDAVFFEEYFFFSHDSMNTGFGFSLISSYNSFPFLPTLVTKYLIERQ